PAPMQPSPREPRLDHKTKCTALNDYESVMARISGLEKSEAPWQLRWFYCVIRKMCKKDFTPVRSRCVCPDSSEAASPWKRDSAANGLSRCVTFNSEKSARRPGLVVLSE